MQFQPIEIGRLQESPLNPRRHFDNDRLDELRDSIARAGILTPILVRPNGDLFEIAAGHRRFRAAKLAGLAAVPAIVRPMDDSTFLEVLICENLAREDLHPLEEADGYRTLLGQPGYDVAAVAAKVGKSESYVYGRLKFSDLIPAAKKAFAADEITAAHAVQIARLQPKDQEQALDACFEEGWDWKQKKNVREVVSAAALRSHIESEIMLDLKSATFSTDAADLVPGVVSCRMCPKRSGFTPALFPDLAKRDTCTDRECFHAKQTAHVAAVKADAEAKGRTLVEISTNWGERKGGPIGQNSYKEASKSGKNACPSSTAAIVTEGHGVGQTKHVCTDRKCKVHWGRSYDSKGSDDSYAKQQRAKEAKAKLETERRRRILVAIAERTPDELDHEGLVRVAVYILEELDNDRQQRADKLFGWNTPETKTSWGGKQRDFKKTGTAWLETATASQLIRFLVTAPLLGEVRAGVYQANKAEHLELAADLYGVDMKAIERELAAEQKEKAAAKKARGKKASEKAGKGAKPKKPAKKAKAAKAAEPEVDAEVDDQEEIDNTSLNDLVDRNIDHPAWGAALADANLPTLEAAREKLVADFEPGEIKRELKAIDKQLAKLGKAGAK